MKVIFYIWFASFLLFMTTSCVSDPTSHGDSANTGANKGVSQSGQAANNQNTKTPDASLAKTLSDPKVAKKTVVPRPSGKLPDACSLVDDAFIAKTVGVNPAAVETKDGSSSASQHARSCFFRWDHKGVANSGILVQIQENPLPEEIDNWASYYIQAKIQQGETNPSTMESFKYKKLENIGESGAYSYEMHRYLWRTDNDKVFMVAVNIRATEEEELKWVYAIGEELMQNYTI
jgi:hypothetical protein